MKPAYVEPIVPPTTAIVPENYTKSSKLLNLCQALYTRSVRKVSDRIFLCEHLMDYNLARLHEPTLNLSAHARIFSRLSIASVAGKQHLSEVVCSARVDFSLQGK